MQAQLKHNPLWRFRRTSESRAAQHITIAGKTLINFASNDYLGLATHTDVIESLATAAHVHGLGSTSSPLFAGYSSMHEALEQAFAAFVGRERALLFNTGYQANLAIMQTFAKRNMTIVADKQSHASILDGTTLAGARLHRYRHQDLAHADQLCQRKQPDIIISEGLFSMSGTISKADQLAAIAQKHSAKLILDDAHSFGVLGDQGRGIISAAKLSHEAVYCLITPFGKALGSMGAMVSGQHAMIETLIQQARPYRYSTALPPAVCAATLTALTILQNDEWRREYLRELIIFFNTEATQRGLPLLNNDITPIRSIVLGNSEVALQLYQNLYDNNLYTACARPPTVPRGSARLRISITCLHNKSDIIHLLDLIRKQLC